VGGVLLPGREITREDLPMYGDDYIQQLVDWDMLEEVKDGRQVSEK